MPNFKFKCLNCEKELTSYRSPSSKNKPKFCGYKCYHEAQSKGLTSHKKTILKFNCENCNREFIVTNRRRRKRKYCSIKCSNIAKRRGRNKRNKTHAMLMINKRKSKSCYICNWSRFIETCHIVSASKGGTYEDVNILYLCPNHHRLFDNNLLDQIEFQKIEDKILKANKYFHIHIYQEEQR